MHPEVLAAFGEITGGEYGVTRNDEPYYVPKGKDVELMLDASSSAVRSLLDIGFYLKHMARPGDLLMVDEPELSLHPENQRRMARLTEIPGQTLTLAHIDPELGIEARSFGATINDMNRI